MFLYSASHVVQIITVSIPSLDNNRSFLWFSYDHSNLLDFLILKGKIFLQHLLIFWNGAVNCARSQIIITGTCKQNFCSIMFYNKEDVTLSWSCRCLSLGQDDVNKINDADQLTASITVLKHQRHEVVFAWHMEDIRFHKPVSKGGQGVSCGLALSSLAQLKWERVCKAVREWMFDTARLESRVIEIPHYKTCGSFQIHWGSFSTWECRPKSTWDVTSCV